MDRQKRPRHYEEPDDRYVQKVFYTDEVLLKVLIPSGAIGGIIGKGGATVKRLKKEAECSFIIGNEKFPGSDDRPSLFRGKKENVVKMFEKIQELVIEHNQRFEPGSSTHLEVKLLVPSNTAARIIGKGGSSIKKMIQETGCYIKIWKLPEDVDSPEEICVVKGDKAGVIKCMGMIVEVLYADAESRSCPNLDYQESVVVGGGGAADYGNGQRMGGMAQTSSSVSSGSGYASTNPGLEGVRALVRGSNFDHNATEDITLALSILFDYGFMDKNAPSPVNLDNVALLLSAGKGSDPGYSQGRGGYDDGMMDVEYGSGGYMGGASRGSYRSQHSYDEADDGYIDRDGFTVLEVLVDDDAVGKIKGPRGQNISDLAELTGAQIIISGKGVYAPGTQKRMVTIKGEAPAAHKTRSIILQQFVQRKTKERGSYPRY